MLSYNRQPYYLGVPRACVLGIFCLFVAACGFQPVYRTTPGTAPVVETLRAVYVLPPVSRLDQVLRNELLFLFGQNAATPREAALYTLKIVANGRSQSAIVSRSGVTSARIYTLSARYALTDTATNEIIFEGQTSGQAAFDILGQQFANIRAERDAENRVASDVARKINDQISVALANHT